MSLKFQIIFLIGFCVKIVKKRKNKFGSRMDREFEIHYSLAKNNIFEEESRNHHVCVKLGKNHRALES